MSLWFMNSAFLVSSFSNISHPGLRSLEHIKVEGTEVTGVISMPQLKCKEWIYFITSLTTPGGRERHRLCQAQFIPENRGTRGHRLCQAQFSLAGHEDGQGLAACPSVSKGFMHAQFIPQFFCASMISPSPSRRLKYVSVLSLHRAAASSNQVEDKQHQAK